MIAAHGLEGVVKRVGHCTDMPAAFLAAAAVVVASTQPEAFGRSAVEAQAMGTPVVVTDLGAVPETWYWPLPKPTLPSEQAGACRPEARRHWHKESLGRLPYAPVSELQWRTARAPMLRRISPYGAWLMPLSICTKA